MYRFNCGIMVLKYLELWEPKKKYDGKSMFAYIGVSTFYIVQMIYLMQ